MRLFVAVTIPSPPAPKLREVITLLKEMGRGVKAVNSGRFHVTLKFLGDTNPELVPQIDDVMRAAALGNKAFEMRIGGMGAFPHRGRPSVVWAGLEGAQTLIEIAGALEKQLEPFGYSREQRPFQPHLTLARVRSKPPEQLFTLLDEHTSTDFGSAPIKTVELIQSDLTPSGPRYTTLATVKLVTEGNAKCKMQNAK